MKECQNSPENSIWEYYGLKRSDASILHWEYTDDEEIQFDSLSAEIDNCPNKALYLAISLNADRIIDRYGSLSGILFRRYNLVSTDFGQTLTHNNNHFLMEGMVKIDWSGLNTAAQIMWEHAYHAILIVNDGEIKNTGVTAVSEALFRKGKNPEYTSLLRVVTSFVHILRGNDGYSINYVISKE